MPVGYPAGGKRVLLWVQDLKELLKGRKIINGFRDQTTKEAFNGMPCMGAYIIGKLKGDDIGGIYLTVEKDSQEYDYELWNSIEGDIMIKVIDPYENKILQECKIDDLNTEE